MLQGQIKLLIEADELIRYGIHPINFIIHNKNFKDLKDSKTKMELFIKRYKEIGKMLSVKINNIIYIY